MNTWASSRGAQGIPGGSRSTSIRASRFCMRSPPTPATRKDSAIERMRFHVALWVAAAHRGYRVYFATHKKLIKQITCSKHEGTLDQFFKRLLSCELWIIDNWAAASMNREIAEEVFDLIDRRKYSSGLVLTSNRAVEEWGEIFPNSVLANATIDRLFEQAHAVVFQDKSYRLKARLTTRELDTTLRNS